MEEWKGDIERMEHTKLPWRVGGDLISHKDIEIATVWSRRPKQRQFSPDQSEADANAAFIVKCCNNFEELVEALEALLTDWHFQMNAYKEMPVETRARAILEKIEKEG